MPPGFARRSSALPSELRGPRASQQRSAPRPHHREACAGRLERQSPPDPRGPGMRALLGAALVAPQDEPVTAVSSTRPQSRTEKWKASDRLVHIQSPTSPRCTYVMAASQDGEVPSPVAGHTVGLGLDGSEVPNFLQGMPQVWDATGHMMQD